MRDTDFVEDWKHKELEAEVDGLRTRVKDLEQRLDQLLMKEQLARSISHKPK
jgi:uncharacterized protein YceH (UPF0502 family)